MTRLEGGIDGGAPHAAGRAEDHQMHALVRVGRGGEDQLRDAEQQRRTEDAGRRLCILRYSIRRGYGVVYFIALACAMNAFRSKSLACAMNSLLTIEAAGTTVFVSP